MITRFDAREKGFYITNLGKISTCYGKVGVFFSLAGGVFTNCYGIDLMISESFLLRSEDFVITRFDAGEAFAKRNV